MHQVFTVLFWKPSFRVFPVDDFLAEDFHKARDLFHMRDDVTESTWKIHFPNTFLFSMI